MQELTARETHEYEISATRDPASGFVYKYSFRLQHRRPESIFPKKRS